MGFKNRYLLVTDNSLGVLAFNDGYRNGVVKFLRSGEIIETEKVIKGDSIDSLIEQAKEVMRGNSDKQVCGAKIHPEMYMLRYKHDGIVVGCAVEMFASVDLVMKPTDYGFDIHTKEKGD